MPLWLKFHRLRIKKRDRQDFPVINQKTVTSFFSYFDDIKNYKKPIELVRIIGIDSSQLPQVAKDTLAFLENEDDDQIKNRYDDLKWKLSAFIHIQDIFAAPLYDPNSILNCFHIWYFFYESKYILIESLLCWLNGFYCASEQLLRLFIEFNLLQNYYYRIARHQESYKCLEEYFEKDVLPKWSTILNKCLPCDNFSKPIKVRLDRHLKGLSKFAAHPYHPNSSPKQSGGFYPEPSLEGIFFYENFRLCIEAVLWMYYVNFPMLFHPVNYVKKFGFNGPIGIFIDEVGHHIIKMSLSKEEYNHFKNYSRSNEKVNALLEYFNTHTDMEEEDIMKSWNQSENGEIANITDGFGKSIAKMRGLREAMALRPVIDKNDNIDPHKILELFSYDKWEKIYKKLGKQKMKKDEGAQATKFVDGEKED